MNCECTDLVKCSNCDKKICKEHSDKVFALVISLKDNIVIENSNTIYHFCSGMCLFLWSLKETKSFYECWNRICKEHDHDNMKIWLPVIEQLREHIQKELEKYDNRI